MDKKIYTLSLSGLMIGPILGFGIVLLPPMALNKLGQRAIYAWIIMMVLGSIFAYVFTKMSLLAPNNEGQHDYRAEAWSFLQRAGFKLSYNSCLKIS